MYTVIYDLLHVSNKGNLLS